MSTAADFHHEIEAVTRSGWRCALQVPPRSQAASPPCIPGFARVRSNSRSARPSLEALCLAVDGWARPWIRVGVGLRRVCRACGGRLNFLCSYRGRRFNHKPYPVVEWRSLLTCPNQPPCVTSSIRRWPAKLRCKSRRLGRSWFSPAKEYRQRSWALQLTSKGSLPPTLMRSATSKSLR